MSKFTIQCRACENQMFVCYANKVGIEFAELEKPLNFVGNSVIGNLTTSRFLILNLITSSAAPDGSELARGSGSLAELITVSIDPQLPSYLNYIDRNPYKTDRRSDLYSEFFPVVSNQINNVKKLS